MTFTPAAVPSLDAIAARPELVTSLPRPVLCDLSLQAQAVLFTLTRALIMAPVTAAPDHDAVLDVAEAARRLGIAPTTLKKRAQTTYRALLIDNRTRRLAFSATRIETFKTQPRAGSAATEPACQSPRRKSDPKLLADRGQHIGYKLLEPQT